MSTSPLATVEIIAAGTELTSGQKLDTNSMWLAAGLRDRGFDVRFHTCVGDAMEDNVSAIRVAASRCDVVLMTGGLGPTRDDITRDALATVIDEPLTLDTNALEDLEAFFVGRGRTMPERNRQQAMRPESATLLANPLGTAPGLFAPLQIHGSRTSLFAAMPGVPSEMRPMFLNEVLPRLPQRSNESALRLIHCYGLGESAAEEALGDLTARGRVPEVGITASSATITLRILATGSNTSECDAMIAADEAAIRERLADYVFGVDDDTLQSVVTERLAELEQTVATAEAGTGGAVLSLLSTANEYSRVFRGGFSVAATCDDEILDLSPPEDPVSVEHARELARVIRSRLSSTFGVAAVCEPSAMFASHFASGEKRTRSRAYVSVDSEGGCFDATIRLLGNPAIHQARIAKTALNLLLRRCLIGETA